MRRARTEESAAVDRRLALLSAELAATVGPGADPAPGSDGHTRVRPTTWDGWPARTTWSPSTPEEPDGDDASPVGASDPWAPDPDPGEGDRAPVLPVPGRHSARRARELPAWWAAVTLAPRHLTVLAVVVAIGLGGTTWWLLRGDNDPTAVGAVGGVGVGVPAPTDAPGATSSTGPAAGAPATVASGPPAQATTGEVTVDVAGKVRKPGVRVLPAGSRVVDALDAAGGARQGVDLSSLNLARVLTDGEQILVGVDPAPGAVPPGEAASVPGAGAPVNLNTADLTLLETLPGVGPVTAQAIVTWRESNGGFTAVDQLVDVDGIGEATLADLAPLVTV